MVSVGSLRVGGSGKTPVVGRVAELLRATGERPAILSRGYAREIEADGVTVVSDGQRILADVRTAGDEPLMLARAHPQVAVLVCASRYLAGRFAEERLGTTVHVLDDGFQHLALARDVDLLLADRADLDDHVLPRGWLREPIAAAARADALLTSESDPAVVALVQSILRVPAVFHVHRTVGPVRLLSSRHVVSPSAGPALALAGIARPERFFDDMALAGWSVADTVAFRDHHRFTAADKASVARRARESGATLLLMTAKDAVRWDEPVTEGLPVAVAELTTTIDPTSFGGWLLDRLAQARARRQSVPEGRLSPLPR